MKTEKMSSRKIRRGAEIAERNMKWHGEHVPYSVYEKLPTLVDEGGDECGKDKNMDS